MCFFVNNQFRIIVEESAVASTNLENVFAENLKRVGQTLRFQETQRLHVHIHMIDVACKEQSILVLRGLCV